MDKIKIAAKLNQGMHPKDAKWLQKSIIKTLEVDLSADVTITFQTKPTGELSKYMDTGREIWMDITIISDDWEDGHFGINELNYATRTVRGETKDELVGMVFAKTGDIGPVKIENIGRRGEMF